MFRFLCLRRWWTDEFTGRHISAVSFGEIGGRLRFCCPAPTIQEQVQPSLRCVNYLLGVLLAPDGSVLDNDPPEV